ncbi:hypothetical protein DMENIID0001_088600 [Sergentomyia squamirostris]
MQKMKLKDLTDIGIYDLPLISQELAGRLWSMFSLWMCALFAAIKDSDIVMANIEIKNDQDMQMSSLQHQMLFDPLY